MTRKDYQLIADAIKRVRDSSAGPQQLDAIRRVAGSIAGALASENPRFDPKRFADACGI